MSETAIRIENLSKHYRLGAVKHRYHTLRDELADGLKSLFRRNGQSPGDVNEIWALKDISHEVKRGEVVGIIGRNGAGKSTLLKILSRITVPTEGLVRIHGRVGSLLEVGTGFHYELTGRENIYLSGAILGMKRSEIERKFDAIVAFAEVEKFIDTPVKRYSSGMFVRLAFAVAAHLEFDILLIDEILAVGDAAFQEKCIGTMERSASGGRTVLFVSHNMASIQHLCKRAILLQSGRIVAEGLPQEVVSTYLSGDQQGSSVSIRDWDDRRTNGQGRIVHFEITDTDGQAISSIPFGAGVRFSILAEFSEPLVDPCFGIHVHNAAGKPLLDLRSIHSGLRIGRVEGGVVVHALVENLGLYPGEYLLSPWISDAACYYGIDSVKFCAKFRVLPAPGPHGDLRLDSRNGDYWVQSSWTFP